jgi:hypothetical protein
MSANQSNVTGSVMMALSELQRIESERVANERALEAERRRQEAERREREREERAEAERHRLRVAEAEARLRVAEEVRAAEAVQRAQRIEDELRVVQAEKAVLAEQLFAAPPPVALPAGYKLWRGVSTAMLVAAVAAGAALFAWPHRPPPQPLPVASRPAPIVVDDSASRQRIDDLEKRVRSLLAKEAKDKELPLARTPIRHKPAAPKPVNITADSVDKCDDPLCFMSSKK